MIKTLLNIVPYIVTSKYLCKLKESLKQHRDTFFEKLPLYCITPPDGKIRITEHHFQFFMGDPEEENYYYMLNAEGVDPILKEELNNAELTYFFENIDFMPLIRSINKTAIFDDYLLKSKKLNDIEELGIPISVHVVVGLEYIGEYEDCELNVYLLGFLDSDLKFVELK